MYTSLLFITLFSILPLIYSESECKTIISDNNFLPDRRENSQQFRFVQYNVEWFFLDYYSNSQCPGSGCTWVNQSEANIHKNYITDVVKTLNADMIHFCEVEGCDELDQLIDNLNDYSYSPYLIKGTDTATGQNVGLITRIDPIVDLSRTSTKYSYPIANSKCGYNGSGGTEGVSKHMITFFNINNINIAFVGAHLLAIPTDPTRCAEREAQAQVLQEVIANLFNEGYEIIVAGDFNDYDGEYLDVNSHIPTSKVLDILKGYEGNFAGEYRLHSYLEKIPQQNRYSDWWDNNSNCKSDITDFSLIDHVLMTEYLFNKINNTFIYQNYDEFCGKYNSDHYPVVIDFLF